MRFSGIALGAAFLGLASLAAHAASLADATGNWKDPDSGAILAFYDCDGDLCAKIQTPSDPNAKDDKNPDPGKRGTPLAGLVILDHGKKDGDAGWKGNLYNANDGKTYSGYATLLDPAKMQLKGCALVVFCKSIVLPKAP